MTAISRSAELPQIAGQPQWAAALRRLRQALLRAIDGLAPAHPRGDYRDLPPEWYEHPPY